MLPITTNENALDEFIKSVSSIDDLLTILKAHCDNHFDTDPDVINWADVGNVNYIKEQLQQVLDFVEDKE